MAKTTRDLSTEEFWDAMCDQRFVRLDRNNGRIENTVYHASVPPENVPGFIQTKMIEAARCLLKPE